MSAHHSKWATAGVWLAFGYLSRDASNYKAFGSVWLIGALSATVRAELVDCLEGGEFFVLEQIGIPPLYPALFEEGGSLTDDDHALHMFGGFRE